MSKLILIFFVVCSNFLYGFPINFGRNQGDIKYDEIIGENFYFYHDHDVPNESVLLINSLETAIPKLKQWFNIKSSDSMIAITSSKTANASFANFFANTIELQTLGSGGRDLAWHELTHMFMYKKFDYRFLHFFLGQSSSVLHLVWMPVWFIEGLAETLSRSSGSSEMASLERYQALNHDWPSYDMLHSLYDGNGFARRGYATSGAFVTWLLGKKKENVLPQILSDVKKYTMPWYYLWSFNPFSSFLPMDYSLELAFKENGRKLYESYKKEARAYWLSKEKSPLLVAENTTKLLLNNSRHFVVNGNMAYVIVQSSSKIRKHKLVFDKKTGWLIGLRPYGGVFEEWFNSKTLIEGSNHSFVVQYGRSLKYGGSTHKLVKISDKEKLNYFKNERVIYSPDYYITRMLQTRNKVLWFEAEKEKTRLCFMDKILFMASHKLRKKNMTCLLEKKFPESINYIGAEDDPSSSEANVFRTIWYTRTKETLKEDETEIFRWDPESNVIDKLPYPYGGKVGKITKYQNGYLLLVSTLSRQVIMNVDSQGKCLTTYDLSDFVLDIDSLSDHKILLSLYKGGYKTIKKVNLSSLKQGSCSYYKSHDSPLLWANRQADRTPTFVEALNETSYRKSDERKIKSSRLLEYNSENPFSMNQKKEQESKSFGGLARLKTKEDIKPARWRGRSLFYLPIILNPNNIYEPGLGVFSIPLMDHRQNHQIWLNAFWNFKNSPTLSAEYRLTRFWPTILISVYRAIRWNGFEVDLVSSDNKFRLVRRVSFISELGADIKINFKWYGKRTTTSLTTGFENSLRKDLTMVSLSDKTIEGFLVKPSLSLSLLVSFEKVSLVFGVRGAYAPPFLNSKFNYNSLGVDVTVLKPLTFLDSSLSFTLSGDRTRGEEGKTPILRQYYTSLKTYIPGGAGGFNDTSYRIVGPDYLFFPLVGDDKVRAELKWRWPIIAHIDKLWWILFLKSLDFTTFLNYGGIWNRDEFDFKKLDFSHAYNIDLQMGNKGVDIYTGLGLGQLVNMQTGSPRITWPALYFRFGFQALF